MGLFSPNIQKLYTEKNIDELLKHTQGGSPETRYKAFLALMDLLIVKEKLEKLRHMLNDKDIGLRTIIVLEFANMGDTESFHELRAIFLSGKRKDKISALRIIADKGSSDNVDISGILAQALNDRDSWVRKEAIRSIGVLKNHLSVDDLIGKLQDNRYQIRVAAARTLGQLRSQKAVESLISLLIDSVKEVRTAAKGSLSLINSPEANEALNNARFMLLADKMEGNVEVKIKTLQYIGKQKIKEALPLLNSACTDNYKLVKINAVKALGRIRDIQSSDVLISMSQDQYWDVRIEACKSLEKINTVPALEALEISIGDENTNVRETAQKCYHSLNSRLQHLGLIAKEQ